MNPYDVSYPAELRGEHLGRLAIVGDGNCSQDGQIRDSVTDFPFKNQGDLPMETNSTLSTDGDCALPLHPAHGHHQPLGGDCGGANTHPACDGTPGTLAPEDWLLTVRCDPGYQHSDPSVADLPSVCFNESWSIPQLPTCKKLCPPLMSNSLRLTCIYGNDEVSCSKHSLPGTKVRFQCLPTFSEDPKKKRQGEYQKSIFCNQLGEWSEALPQCKAECGMSQIVTLTPTIVDGKEAYVGFFPWHAGLYYSEKKDENIWVQKCGGTLINDQVILTAAHCVNNVIQPSDLRVALGKYYRSWDHYETTEVKRNVSAIVYPNEYGRGRVHTFDLALVLMSQKVTFSEAIMPACRDYKEGIDHLVRAKLYVVGWGKTSSGGSSSEHLLYNTVNSLTEEACKNTIPRDYYSFDKICAFKNNSVSIPQHGDSGGGLTAVYEDGLHYVVGVISSKANVSLSPNTEVSLFTNIKWKTHLDWIDSKLTQF